MKESLESWRIGDRRRYILPRGMRPGPWWLVELEAGEAAGETENKMEDSAGNCDVCGDGAGPLSRERLKGADESDSI